MPSIHIDKLDPETAAKLKPKRKTRERDESAAAKKRGATGRGFEGDLDMTHEQYEFMHWGKIWRHSPPFVMVKGKWIPRAGGGPVDRTGHVFAVRSHSLLRGTDRLYGSTEGGMAGTDFVAREKPTCLPVAFDAKVLGREHVTYQHEKKSQHQLHQLRDAARSGVKAFLLVHAPVVDLVFLVGIENHFTDLVSGRGVKLYETVKSGPQYTHALSDGRRIFSLVPAIERGKETRLAPFCWDWIPLLDHV